MEAVTNTATTLDPAMIAGASKDRRRKMLRQAVDETVGVTFFGEMLKIARNSKLKGTIGHGGRGEDMFGPQLDMELARRAGKSMKNSLSDAIYNRLAKGI
jgi:hypothetical protein